MRGKNFTTAVSLLIKKSGITELTLQNHHINKFMYRNVHQFIAV